MNYHTSDGYDSYFQRHPVCCGLKDEGLLGCRYNL